MPSQKANNGMKLFKYLEELSLLNAKVRTDIRKLSSEEEKFELDDDNFLPILDGIFLKSRYSQKEKSKDIFLSIKKYNIDNPPELPKELKRWMPDYPDCSSNESKFKKPDPEEFIFIIERFDNDKERVIAFKQIDYDKKPSPILDGWITKGNEGNYKKIIERQKKIYFKNFPELVELYKNWRESSWNKWEEENYKYFKSNKAYEKLYSLRSFLKTEKDSYDLLWSHDILTWSQKKKEIYHPVFLHH